MVTPACNGQPCKMMFLRLTPFFRTTRIICAKDRGLTENSLLVYVPFVRDFLAAQTTQAGGVSPKCFGTLIIRNFILEHTLDRSSEYARLLCTALRPFSPSVRPDLAGPL